MLLSTLFSLLLVSASCNAFFNKRAAVQDCLTAAKVPQLTPGTADFAQAIKPFNLRLPFTPVAVAQPTTTQHVQDAVACGAKLGLQVSPKGGGHSYASHGLGGEDGHLMVDMKYWTNVTVDQTTFIASVGTGARLGNVATALYAQGKRALSHGTCPGVGIAGHVVGGGYGYASRTYGLALDLLVEATVVLANSTVVTASNTTNGDLFWAIRGAGASFGIIVNYKFQTFPAPASVVVYNYGLSFGSIAAAKTAHAALQAYANSSTMPSAMNMRAFVTSYGTTLEGTYYGDTATFQTLIKPVLTSLGAGNAYGSVQTQDWMTSLSTYAYGSLTTPLNYDTHETFYSKSLMTVNLNDAALTAFWTYWYNTARSVSRDWYLIIDLHGGPSSAISKVPDTASSYAHRNALLKYEFYDRVDSGTYPTGGQSFLNGWVGSILNAMPTTNFGMYINYADSDLNATTAHSAYWLSHYQNLTAVKASYDPKLLFNNPQAVKLT